MRQGDVRQGDVRQGDVRPGDMRRGDATLDLIHGVILASIVILCAVVAVLIPVEPSPLPGLAQWMWLPVVVLAVFAVGVLRGRLAAEGDPARRRQGAIVLWAVAEGAGLASLAFAYVTGSWIPLTGALVAVFLLLYHRPATLADGGR